MHAECECFVFLSLMCVRALLLDVANEKEDCVPICVVVSVAVSLSVFTL